MTSVHRLETGWLPETPVGDTVLRRFLHNQIEVNELIATARGGRVERTDDVSLVAAGPVTVFVNQAVLRRPLADDADPVLDEIEAFYRGQEGQAALLVSIWPTPDLSRRGWQLMGHPAFMVRAPAPCAAPAGDAIVRTVTSPDNLRAFENVMLEGYPMPPAADGAPTFADAVLDSPVTMRLAYIDNAPVAAGASHLSHGVVNLCMAATLPAARRRGAWAALVWRRVADDSTLPAVAFTSDYSRPGFERMGFLPITRFTLWTRSE
jgi:hypothetical protein